MNVRYKVYMRLCVVWRVGLLVFFLAAKVATHSREKSGQQRELRARRAGASRMAAVVIPPHCPSCRAPVTLTCPNLKEALIVCSDEAVRPVPRVPATPG